jgi:hypothetical protein
VQAWSVVVNVTAEVPEGSSVASGAREIHVHRDACAQSSFTTVSTLCHKPCTWEVDRGLTILAVSLECKSTMSILIRRIVLCG